MLNLAPRHKYVWESGGVIPRVLNVGTRSRCVNFMHLRDRKADRKIV